MNGNTNGRTKARLMTTRLRTAMPIVIMASQRPTMTGSERRASASLRSKSLGHPCLSTAFLAWQVLQPLALRLQLIVSRSFHLNYFCAVVFSSLAIIEKFLGWPNLPCFYNLVSLEMKWKVQFFPSSDDAAVHRVGVFSFTDVGQRLFVVYQPFWRDCFQQELSGGSHSQSSN